MRTVLVHLNVEVSDESDASDNEVGAAAKRAVDVAAQAGRYPALVGCTIHLALVEETHG